MSRTQALIPSLTRMCIVQLTSQDSDYAFCTPTDPNNIDSSFIAMHFDFWWFIKCTAAVVAALYASTVRNAPFRATSLQHSAFLCRDFLSVHLCFVCAPRLRLYVIYSCVYVCMYVCMYVCVYCAYIYVFLMCVYVCRYETH